MLATRRWSAHDQLHGLAEFLGGGYTAYTVYTVDGKNLSDIPQDDGDSLLCAAVAGMKLDYCQ